MVLPTKKIWLLLGQSFMAGQSNTTTDLPVAYKGVKIQNNQGWDGSGFQSVDSTVDGIPTATPPNNRANIMYFMGDIADYLGETIYFLNYSQGATALASNPNPDWNTATVGELYDGVLAEISAIKLWMDARGYNYIIEGCAWYQGQADANTLAYANAYEANLIAFMDDVITASGNPNLKIYQDYIEDAPTLTYVYKSTVNAAKDAFVALDTTNRRVFQPNYAGYVGVHPTVAEYYRVWNVNLKPLILADL